MDLVWIVFVIFWTFDSALNITCVGSDYEVGEDKIGIFIFGLMY